MGSQPFRLRRAKTTPRLERFCIAKAIFSGSRREAHPQAVHVGFVAKDHSEVDAFYKAALAVEERARNHLELVSNTILVLSTWVLILTDNDIEVP